MTAARQLPEREAWLLQRLEGLGAMPQITIICDHYGETVETVLLSDYRHTAPARHAVWNLLNKAYKLKPSNIARMFGAHHSTVITALRKIKTHDENIVDTGIFIRVADGYERVSPLPPGRHLRASGL